MLIAFESDFNFRHTDALLAGIKNNYMPIIEKVAKELLIEFKPGTYGYGLFNDGVVLEYYAAHRISEEIKGIVDEYKYEIINGLTIPRTEEELAGNIQLPQ